MIVTELSWERPQWNNTLLMFNLYFKQKLWHLFHYFKKKKKNVHFNTNSVKPILQSVHGTKLNILLKFSTKKTKQRRQSLLYFMCKRQNCRVLASRHTLAQPNPTHLSKCACPKSSRCTLRIHELQQSLSPSLPISVHTSLRLSLTWAAPHTLQTHMVCVCVCAFVCLCVSHMLTR